ncbi:THAP domain [Popillia japonica]|uniref:THAP domain n=1 Tax=Popillia japonica TaxID=7064 RepID=A0AAW1LV42_POPJA
MNYDQSQVLLLIKTKKLQNVQFPRRPADRQRWLGVLQLTEEIMKQKPKPKVCAAHFHLTCFSKSATSVPRLLPGALPNKLPYKVERETSVSTVNEAKDKYSLLPAQLTQLEFSSRTQAVDERTSLGGDPTLPIIDDCSTCFMMFASDDIENVSRNIPIMDEYSFLTTPTGIDVELPIIGECSSVPTSLLNTYSPSN